MSLFGTHKVTKGTIDEVAAMVHHYFHARGLNPSLQELSTMQGCGWWLQQGSARVYIFVQNTEAGPVIRITSPIVFVPDNKREEFFRSLLTTNANLSGCSLSLHDNTVLVVAQRHTANLEQEELDDLVWTVAFVADTLDNQLAREYGAKLYTESHN